MTAAMVRIQYSGGGVEPRTLADGVYTIGRDAGDIALADADVSAVHARLEVRNGRVWATDLGSTNGTLDANVICASNYAMPTSTYSKVTISPSS